MKHRDPQQPNTPGELIDLTALLKDVPKADDSLDDILAEFSDQVKAEKARDEREDTIPIPLTRPTGSRTVAAPPAKPIPPAKKPDPQPEEAAEAEDAPAPAEAPPADTAEESPTAQDKPASQPEPAEEEAAPPDNLVHFRRPAFSLKRKLAQLRHQADQFADNDMFHEEDNPDTAAELADRYIPGTDEEAPAPARPERRPRPEPRPAPDTPPAELAKEYTKGLNSLRLRCVFSLLLCLPLFYLTFQGEFGLPVPPVPEGLWPLMQTGALALGIILQLLLCLDLVMDGLAGLFRGRSGPATLAAFAGIFTLADAAVLALNGGTREAPLPYCALAALALSCCMWGEFARRRGLRTTCKTAALSKEPYLVTRDEAKWNGKGTFSKHKGPATGFGSAVQALDGAQRIYRIITPVLLLAALLFALLSSVGRQAPERFLWCFSVILTVGCPLAGLSAFGRPFARLAERLSESGAALAGWPGVAATSGPASLIVTDTDLFPPGSVTLNGIKVFGDFALARVIGCTASLIRESDSGLNKIFADLVRTEGASFREVKNFCCYEGGGLSADVWNQPVLVGSVSFMKLMGVPMPQGLNVKNAVFCAIDGELAGIFALNYTQPGTIYPALQALIRSHVAPVLATRDFNITPAMLQQRFRLPGAKMDFPPVERRLELSAGLQDYAPDPCAVLNREGLGPFAEAVVGGRRLKRAVQTSAVLNVLASIAGLLLSFYLTFVSGYSSLAPVNVLFFQVAWALPTLILSRNVNQF